jgi:hypothetical protein
VFSLTEYCTFDIWGLDQFSYVGNDISCGYREIVVIIFTILFKNRYIIFGKDYIKVERFQNYSVQIHSGQFYNLYI